MKAKILSLAAWLSLLAGSGTLLSGERDQAVRIADAARATPGEMNFVKIPWVTDLFEGFRLAKEERRPLFLYLITGDPLDDC